MNQTLTRRERRAAERALERGRGYICKTCAGPAPMGVGYVASGPAAEAASSGRTSCPCGASRTPEAAR